MNNHVQTAIRWRPAVPNREVSIEKVNKNVLSVGRQFRTYLFDYVFDSSAATDSQAEVYNVLVRPLIDRAFEGYDCTFLAIGQTGSGKTYTVGFDQSVNSEHDGMTARVLKSIFSYQKAEQIKVLISFIEIYNEQAFDLLDESQQEPFYNKENRFTEPTKKSIKSECDVLSLLAQASKRRHIRNTVMNSVSSRSHAVFIIYLGIKHAEMDIRESVINIVDLAGSEGFAKTGNIAGSEAHMEGKCINESLSAFKRVINAMSCGQKYIPFRDSVITTFLKKALNSQSYLTLLGCVSPYFDDYGETLSTIRFVSEAKQLKRTPQLNAVISDFQKSKTPVKTALRASTSTLGSVTTNSILKRSASMSTGIPSKRPFSIPRMMSVPPKKLSFTTNSNEFHRFERSSMASSSSTTKRFTAFNRQSQLNSFAGTGPKAVANLFPMTLTPSRRLIENLLNNKNDESNKSINFCDASTSSTVALVDMDSISQMPSSSSTSPEGVKTHLSKIINSLAGPAFQLLSSEVEKRMAENSDRKLRPHQIMESFHAVLNKLLAQDALKESLPTKNPMKLSPLAEKSNESGMATVSSGNQAETTSNSISVDVNHATKQILVEVLATPNDTLPLPSLLPELSGNPNTSQSEYNVGIGLESTDQIVLYCQNSAVEPDKMQALNQSMAEKSLDPSTSTDEVDRMMNQSYETPINASMAVQLTPIEDYRYSFERNCTPIGTMRLRQTMNTTYDIPVDTIDDNSVYEILMVSNDRFSPLKKVRFSPVDRIIMGTTEHEDIAGEAPVVSQVYPLPASDAIASTTTANNQRFPIAPNAILDRINTLQEYDRSITMQNIARVAAESMRMQTQQRRRFLMGNPQAQPPKPRPSMITRNVFNILNCGTIKELTTLATIGPKTAAKILQNREQHGQFECIDAILRMPFWSKKKHRRFLEQNVHCQY